jgi:uncharacterized protein (DUF2235 family)
MNGESKRWEVIRTLLCHLYQVLAHFDGLRGTGHSVGHLPPRMLLASLSILSLN